jgi:hypothetical protein
MRGQDGQNETEQPDHSASLDDSVTSSTRIEFSVHTPSLVFLGFKLNVREFLRPCFSQFRDVHLSSKTASPATNCLLEIYIWSQILLVYLI